MKKELLIKILVVFISLVSFFGFKQNYILQIDAQDCPTDYTCSGGCHYLGQCVNNKICTKQGMRGYVVIAPGNESCGSAIIGGVTPPKGVSNYNWDWQTIKSGGNIGVLVFASKLLKLIDIVAGLLIFANFTIAGYSYIISAGNTSIMTEIKDKLTFSIVGIVIIVVAYTAAAIIGLIFFGNASFILNPDITKYGALAP